MSSVFRLADYRWQHMLSIWGQEQVGHQGACYASLTYSPKTYIKKMGEDAPPVQKWILRYPALPFEDAQWWLSFLLKHIFPDDLKKEIVITRASSKSGWPIKWARNDITNPPGDWDAAEPDKKLTEGCGRRYSGSVPWLQVDFSQRLSCRTIFATGVFLRYASEHGAAIIATRALLNMQIPGIGPDQALALGHLLGSARGHTVSNFGYFPKNDVRRFLDTYSWKERFQKLMGEDLPFHKQPEKEKDVDTAFNINWTAGGLKRYPEVCSEPYAEGELTHNGITLQTQVRQEPLNLIMSEWIIPEIKEVRPAPKKKVVRKRSVKVQPNYKGFDVYADIG